MPAAYTHLYIAEKILDRLRHRVSSGAQAAVVLRAVDGSGEQHKIPIQDTLAQILEQNQSYFRAGAVGPDFFPDVFFGITVSHQTDRKSRSLSDYCTLLAEAIDFSDASHTAFAFGWLTHLCGDVYGHHWVNMESGGDFQTWVDTPPDIIRKHLGLEVLWDSKLPSVPRDFTVPVDLVRRAMLTESSTLCSEFYNDTNYSTLHMLILLVRLATWHTAQAEKARRLRDGLSGPEVTERLKSLCPQCKAVGVIEGLLEKPCEPCNATGVIKSIRKDDCPTCKATGVSTKTITENCPVCAASGMVEKAIDVPCATCEATGAMTSVFSGTCMGCWGKGHLEEVIKGCALCKGDGKLECPNCGGDGKVGRLKLPCPLCIGIGRVSCPHNAGETVLNVIKKTCPTCDGAKHIRRTQSVTCHICAGTKVIKQVSKETCPTCVGAKILQKVTEVTCVVCNGLKVIDITTGVVCTVCNGAMKLLVKVMKECPICRSLQTRELLAKCIDRVVEFHRRRSARSIEIVDDYIRAHECFVRRVLDKEFGDILKCYDTFFDKLIDYLNLQRTLLELLAPELVDLEKHLERLIERYLESVKELVPPWIAEIKKQVFEIAIKTAAEKLQLPLKDDEREHFNRVFTDPIDGFGPLSNGITLYLLGLDGCGPDKAGFTRAAKVLGSADNIDKRCQAYLTIPFSSPSAVGDQFVWEKYFLPFIDCTSTEAHCRLAGFYVRPQ